MRMPGRPGDAADGDQPSPEEAGPTPVRLGDWLRAERLRRGFSYAEIERDTRINRLYLEALEDERFEVLPAPVYTRGFLRSYARALGLDPERAIALLPAELPRPEGLEPSPSMRRPSREAPAVVLPKLPGGRGLRAPSFKLPSLPSSARGGSNATQRTANRGASAAAERNTANARPSFGGGFTGSRLPSLPGLSSSGPLAGASANAWVLAAAGVLLLLVAAFTVPRMFSGNAGQGASGDTPGATVSGKMPNLVGKTQDAAHEELSRLGLTWLTLTVESQAPQNQIVGQTPVANADIASGNTVTLIVSRGPR